MRRPERRVTFRFDSHGEEVYLYSADASGALTGYSDGFAFPAVRERRHLWPVCDQHG